MEKIKLITKIDYRTLKYCNLFIIKYRRRAHIWMSVTGLLALGAAAYGYFYLQQPLFGALGAGFAAYIVYQQFSVEKKLDLSLERFFYNRPVTSQTVEVDENEIIVTRTSDPSNPTTFDWSYVTEIDEMPQFYMLMIGKGAPIIIDRSDEALLEGSKSELDRIIAEKAQLKPYKKVEKDITKRPITYVHQEFPSEDVKDVDSVVSDVNDEEKFEKVITNDEVDNKDYRDLVSVEEPKIDEEKED